MHALMHSYIPHSQHIWSAEQWPPKMSISKFCLSTYKAKRGLGRFGDDKAIAIRDDPGVPGKCLGAISYLSSKRTELEEVL